MLNLNRNSEEIQQTLPYKTTGSHNSRHNRPLAVRISAIQTQCLGLALVVSDQTAGQQERKAIQSLDGGS